MNTYGERVKVTIFGESHGPAIGVVLDGVPAGEAIDMDAVRIQMRRRAPGSSDLTTHRSETDDPLVMSGILNGVDDNRAAPGAEAERAQVAAMLARYIRNL